MPWQARRLTAFTLAHAKELQSPFLAANWEQAFAEARARQVPVVVFWLESESKGPLRDPYTNPEYCRWLFQSAVALVAVDNDHHGAVTDGRIPVVGRACDRFHYTSCEEHQRLRKRLKKLRKRDGSLQILIFSPKKEILLWSKKVKKGVKLSEREFDRGGLDGDVLDRAQAQIGPPVMVYDVSPLKSGFKAEGQALFGRGRREKLKGFADLVKKIETLPKRAPEEGRAWVEGWLRWRSRERLGMFLDQARKVRKRRGRKKAFSSLEKIVKSQPELLAELERARAEFGE